MPTYDLTKDYVISKMLGITCTCINIYITIHFASDNKFKEMDLPYTFIFYVSLTKYNTKHKAECFVKFSQMFSTLLCSLLLIKHKKLHDFFS